MSFLNNTFYSNTIQAWLIAIAIFLATVFLAKTIFYLFKSVFQRFTKKTRTKLDDIILDKSRQPFIFLTLLLAGRYALSGLYFEDTILDFTGKFFTFSFIIVFTWLGSRVADTLITEIFQNISNEDKPVKKDSISPVLRKSARFLIWIPGVIMALNNAGLDVGALLAGLGIGGLAVALASQDTVKNMIGGLIILFDKPFGLGDTIQVDTLEGEVEDIGLRSTRIRNTNGKEVSIPNTLFSDKPIVNISREKNRIIQTSVFVSYENETSTLETACQAILEMLKNQKEILPDHNSVTIAKLLSQGVELKVTYWIQAGLPYFDIESRINILLLDALARNNVKIIQHDV